MNDIERIEHLEKLLQYIDERSTYTSYNFESLYEKLNNEFNKETMKSNNLSKNHYLNNLRQTIEKEAASFKEARRTDKPSEFGYFIRAFTGDIDDELMRLKRPSPL